MVCLWENKFERWLWRKSRKWGTLQDSPHHFEMWEGSALPHCSICSDFCTNFRQKHPFLQKVFLPHPWFIGRPFRINFIVHSGTLDILFTVRSVWARTVSVIEFLVLCNCFCAFWPTIRWNKQTVYYFFIQYTTCWFKQLRSVRISGRPIRRIWGFFPSLSKEAAWRMPLLGRRRSQKEVNESRERSELSFLPC